MYHELVLDIVYHVGVLLLILIALLFVFLFLHRLWSIYRDRRMKQINAIWSQHMVDAIGGTVPKVPKIRRRDILTVLFLWNRFQETLIGESRDRLNELARNSGINHSARQLLMNGRLSQRLLAISTLGHMRDRDVWDRLTPFVVSSHTTLSVAAARALVQINAEAAITLVLDQISSRDDWPPRKTATILQEAGADTISKPLVRTILDAPNPIKGRLLPYVEFIHQADASTVLRQLAQQTNDPGVLSVCLRVMQDPVHLSLVRSHVRHPESHVRKEVAAALGRMGSKQDVKRLVGLLSDEAWYVRYEAAKALTTLPFVDKPYLKRIQRSVAPRRAKKVLQHVIAEHGLS